MSDRKKATNNKDSSANHGFEAKLWVLAHKQRNLIHQIAPQGMTVLVLADRSMSSNQSGKGGPRL